LRPADALSSTIWEIPVKPAHTKLTIPFAHASIHHLTLATVSALPGLLEFTHAAFAEIVAEGMTYPQEASTTAEYTRETFGAYYWAADVFVALGHVSAGGAHITESEGGGGEAGGAGPEVVERERAGRSWEECVIGFYYVKPNYPGRSSHVSHVHRLRRAFPIQCIYS